MAFWMAHFGNLLSAKSKIDGSLVLEPEAPIGWDFCFSEPPYVAVLVF